MTTHKNPTMLDRIYAGGSHGNLSVAPAKAAVSTAAGDVINLLDIPAGIQLLAVRVATDGLGAGVKATVKLGETVLASDVDVATASGARVETLPHTSAEKAVLSVTLSGAAASGELWVTPEYIARGTI